MSGLLLNHIRTCIVLLCVTDVFCQSGLELVRLKTQLFTTNNYNTKVRPVTDQSNSVTISVDFALVGINSFSDSDQKLTTTGYLTVKWTDQSLTWTPSSYDGITSILVPQNEIWKPDITLDNGMESKTSLGQSFIQVYSKARLSELGYSEKSDNVKNCFY